jgi:hypothetical protein
VVHEKGQAMEQVWREKASGAPDEVIVQNTNQRPTQLSSFLYFLQQSVSLGSCAAQKFRLASKLTDTMGNRQTTV